MAWKEKARRFGYVVSVVDAASPHPGAEYYLEAFAKAMSPRTKVTYRCLDLDHVALAYHVAPGVAAHPDELSERAEQPRRR